jgi:hypothetical protein
VHGTDVITGQPVMLAVEETEATHAVQAALSKRIVVSHVTREGVRRALLPLACAGVVVLAGLCAWLMQREGAARADLAVVRARELMANTELPVVAVAATPHAAEPSAALTALAERLHAAEERVSQLATEAKTAEADKQQALAVLNSRSQSTTANETQAAAAIARASHAESELAALQHNNQTLHDEIDALKTQLLVSAAKPAPDAPAVDNTEKEPAEGSAPLRWALHASYDAASDFIAMHFAKETMHTESLADGTFTWSAASAANAATVRITHDREKSRVYSATLAVSLAPDGPKDKLAENLQLVTAFLRSFAPGLKNAAARATHVVNELSTHDGSDRCVLMGADTRVMVWNNGNGMYSWRADSVGNDLGG